METQLTQRVEGGSIPTLPLQFLKKEWMVKDVSIATGRRLIEKLHYSKGASNTRTYLHGLFLRGFEDEDDCLGVCWWIPPTKSAAIATYPKDWKGVLSLSRMAVEVGVPKNACSFMLSKSSSLIDRARWPALVTYADEWRNHTGSVYLSTNWVYVGKTKPEKTYTLNGRMTSRKRGPKTMTHAQMMEMGCELVGSFPKRKFVNIKVC